MMKVTTSAKIKDFGNGQIETESVTEADAQVVLAVSARKNAGHTSFCSAKKIATTVNLKDQRVLVLNVVVRMIVHKKIAVGESRFDCRFVFVIRDRKCYGCRCTNRTCCVSTKKRRAYFLLFSKENCYNDKFKGPKSSGTKCGGSNDCSQKRLLVGESRFVSGRLKEEILVT